MEEMLLLEQMLPAGPSCRETYLYNVDHGGGLQATMKGVQVPSSVPQLTTKHVLTMSFVEGQPITRLRVNQPYHVPWTSICLHMVAW